MEIYVIFTGERAEKPNELKLSSHYKKDGLNFVSDKNSLELIVKMIYDSNEGDIVFQYINFCKVFNMQMALNRTDKDKAVKETIRICKDKSLLDEYIKKHESEVIDTMSDFIFNEKLLNEIHFRSELRIAREKGHDKGLKKGIKQGIAKGLEQGLEKGRNESQIEIARNLLSMGFQQEQIAQATGLTLEQVNDLQVQ